MTKGLFVTATGTDVGKTYIAALLSKTLRRGGYACGYYKAAVSGAPQNEDCDADYVNKMAKINDPPEFLLSYRYTHAVSPHLAARWEGNQPEKEVICHDYETAKQRHAYLTVEGSGGIVCPIRHDGSAVYYLTDIISWFRLPSVIVSSSGLGSINSAVLTAHYMRALRLPVKGFILNRYTDTAMERDNAEMIEELTALPVLATVAPDEKTLPRSAGFWASLYE
ncbi:dethiobiotin synthase [Megasphaera vaginalis (ex Srinivasan et al. 2021)]|uniref:ATP-dependent dethiobiotin synthetase BioD n=1 Tax=Megasphaera vaginalis (ex Srinivasan et al. 2021) TaxID=1111454 RepID=U7UU34_9FIRM|nr:dethiobiotin synthase [Megasphaera vaginalis (ex Srinivasan et al. 2021)]ERT61978.1 dethiobiotin synthase [Megasphaera vaginalis (ex Srinivasan et al. 2021)]